MSKGESQKKYATIEEWEKTYFPSQTRIDRLGELIDDPSTLGTELANNSLARIKVNFEVNPERLTQ